MTKDKEKILAIDTKSIPVKILLIVLVILAIACGWFAVRWQIGNLLADITSPNQEDARQSAESANNFAPGDPITNWLMARVEKENNPEFTEGFEKVVRMSPYDYRWWIQLGRAYEQADEPEKAEKALKRAVELAPKHTFPHWQIGNFYLRQDRDKEAFEALKLAAADNFAYREQILSIAWEYYDQNIEKLETIVGDSPDVRVGLAKFYAAKERPKKSLEMWNSLTEEAKKENDQTARVIAQALFDKKFLLSSVEFVRQTGIEKNAEAEKVSNGSFEESLDEPDKVFFGWKVFPVEKMRVRLSSFKSKEGNKSVQLSFSGFNKVEINNLYQTIPVRSGESYTLKFHVKTENLKSAGTPKIEVLNFNDNKILASSESFTGGTNDWKEYMVRFVVPEDSEGVTIRTARTYCGDNCPIVGSLWYDDFTLDNN